MERSRAVDTSGKWSIQSAVIPHEKRNRIEAKLRDTVILRREVRKHWPFRLLVRDKPVLPPRVLSLRFLRGPSVLCGKLDGSVVRERLSGASGLRGGRHVCGREGEGDWSGGEQRGGEGRGPVPASHGALHERTVSTSRASATPAPHASPRV